MGDEQAMRRLYLTPPLDSFWRWSDDGEVLVWPDGATLAFRLEARHLLSGLVQFGLPPLACVALVSAACRDNWVESSARLEKHLSRLVDDTRAKGGPRRWLQELFKGLDAVNALEPSLRRTPDARAVLAEVVFEDFSLRTTPEAAREILEALDGEWLAPVARTFEPRVRQIGGLLRELDELARALKRVHPETLELRRKTGLDSLIESAEVELPPVERARRLIADLERDDELSGVARLARNLMAAINLPRSLSDRDELPLGGVSDITNRGPLDRLLLSELAHDDETLAVRVATNEALYLRREAPPRTPPHCRAILLDCGIRMWGLPRVFATAVGLALVATGERSEQVIVFRSQDAAAGTIAPVDLTTRAGLVEHLAALSHDAHPGHSPATFLSEIEHRGESVDAILVTHAEALDDPEFQRALSAVEFPLLYVAAVRGDGRLRLFARSFRGTRLLREVRLPLDELLKSSQRPSVPLIDPRQSDLPAILKVKPFPLRMSHEIDRKRTWYVKGAGLFSITGDRRLMLWDEPRSGAVQLSDDAPVGRPIWIGPVERGETSVVIASNNGLRLDYLTVNLKSREFRAVRLDVSDEAPRGVARHGGALLIVYARHVDALSHINGERLGHVAIPKDATWVRDRFFHQSPGWLAASFDGMGVRFDSVVRMPRTNTRSWVSGLIDVVGHDGPIGFTMHGELYFTHSSKLETLHHKGPPMGGVLAASPDGTDVLMACGDAGAEPWRVDLLARKTERFYGRIEEWQHPWSMLATPVNLRNQFVAAYVGPDGVITLVANGGRHWRIEFFTDRRLALGRLVKFRTEEAPTVHIFQPIPSPSGAGYRLKAIDWEGGGRMVLDSRGLLHLMSGDRGVPELTLALANHGTLGAWAADGRVWGPKYFIGSAAEPSPPAELFDLIREFTIRLT